MLKFVADCVVFLPSFREVLCSHIPYDVLHNLAGTLLCITLFNATTA